MDVIAELIRYPLSLDPNYNKSHYHAFMGAKLMIYAEYLMFSYNVQDFTNNLNELFKFLIMYSTIIEEFPTFVPVIVTAIKYIRNNPILFAEQTQGFQLTRQLLDNSRYLKEVMYTPVDHVSKSGL